MSETGRASLKLIFDSDPYKAWAAVPANLPEVTKVNKAYAGQPFTTPSSKYAKGLCGLCKENPPPGSPIPPPPAGGDVAAVFRKDNVMVSGGLSNFHGDARQTAFELGWKQVAVQLLHTAYAGANEAEMALSQWNAFEKIGWGTYGQNSDPFEDGKEAAALCKRLPALKAWKANGEAWAEGAMIAKTRQFINGWVAGGAPVPLGWSVLSSDTANFPRNYDYAAAMSIAGADIDIQVYGASHPTYTVAAGLGMLSKVPVPVSRTTMTFDLSGDGRGPFGDYRTWQGPRRVFNDGRATAETFRQLVRP